MPHAVFLANDAVFNEGLAFLESFRTYNPMSPLSMIPFADDVERFDSIAKIYNFDILQLNMGRWDDLARELYPNSPQKFRNRLRKLAVFDVNKATAVYIDIDIVVLKDLSFLDAKIIDGTADFICTGTHNDPFVYNEQYKLHHEFDNCKRFSDGFFAFNPRRISADTAYRVLTENMNLYLEIRSLQVYSQPATNFVVDMLNLNVMEVYRLFRNVAPQTWYNSPRLTERNDGAVCEDGREVLCIHWAGPVDFDADFRMKGLFSRYQSAALARLSDHGVSIRSTG